MRRIVPIIFLVLIASCQPIVQEHDWFAEVAEWQDTMTLEFVESITGIEIPDEYGHPEFMVAIPFVDHVEIELTWKSQDLKLLITNYGDGWVAEYRTVDYVQTN